MSPKTRTLVIWLALIGLFLVVFRSLDHDGASGSGGRDVLGDLLPVLLAAVVIMAVVLWLLRRRGLGGNWMAMRGTTARLVARPPAVTFDDVAGVAEVKEALESVVDFLKHPERWRSAGARLPRGVLLEGPAGSGKTLLARAVAGEAKVAFFEVSASEFVELFVGIGAARVRDLFEQARKKAPAVIFIDELDAVGRRRGAAAALTSHQEREQTLNQLLVCLDGFRDRQQVVVIAATNRADVLDAALLRPGRFDLRLRMPPLELVDRRRALEIHGKGKPLAPDIDFGKLASDTHGFTGAEIEQLVNDATLGAVRRSRGNGGVHVTRADFEQAFTRRAAHSERLDLLDSLLVESASQLAQATGRIVVRAEIESGEAIEGDVVWADNLFLKIERTGGAGSVLVPKYKILKLQSLPGTDAAHAADLVPDLWARLRPDVG